MDEKIAQRATGVWHGAYLSADCGYCERHGGKIEFFAMKTETLFQTEVDRLVRKLLWGISFGVGAGSRVALEFGEKIKRDKPVNQSSPKLGDDETFFMVKSPS